MSDAQSTCPVSRGLRILLSLVLALGIALPVAIAAWHQVASDWRTCGELSSWMKQGDAAFQAGDYTVAVRMFARARQADPSSSKAARAFARSRVFDIAWRPEALQGADLSDVLVDVSTVEGEFPGDKATATALRGFVAAGQGRITEGEALYRKALESDAANGPAHLGLALLMRRDPDKTKEALAEMQAVVKARPKAAEYLAILAGIELDLGDLKSAATHFGDALALRENPDWLRDLGQALLGQGDVKGAVEKLNASIRLDSRNAETPNLMAQAMLMAQQYPQAEAAARQSLSIKQSSTAASRLAQALNAQKKYQEALPILQQLLQQQRDILMMIEFATALEGTGRLPEAAAVYRQILGAQLPKEQMESKMFQQVQATATQRLEAIQQRIGSGAPSGAAPAAKKGGSR